MFSSLISSLLIALQVLLVLTNAQEPTVCNDAREVYEEVLEGIGFPVGSSIDSIFSTRRLQGKDVQWFTDSV